MSKIIENNSRIMKLQNLTLLLRDGLANRMRVIASIVHLAKQGVKVEVLWSKNWALNCNFEDLFEPIDGIDIKNITKEPVYYDTIQNSTLKKLYSKLHGLIHGYDYIFYSPGLKFEKQLSDNDFMQNIFCQNKRVFLTTCFCVTATQDYSVFKPKEEITTIQNQIKLPSKYIGIHIRRGDNVASMENSRIEGFIDIIKYEISINHEVRFFLATDSYDVKTLLKIVFGTDRIISIDNTISRDSEKGIKEALAEMIILSNADKIIGSACSTFNEIAALLHNTELIKVTTTKC